MDAHARPHDESVDDADGPPAIVTGHETRPGKLVLTERHNTDGWIASDLVVDLVR